MDKIKSAHQTINQLIQSNQFNQSLLEYQNLKILLREAEEKLIAKHLGSITHLLGELCSHNNHSPEANLDTIYGLANDFIQILLEKNQPIKKLEEIIFDKTPMLYHNHRTYDKAIDAFEKNITTYNYLLNDDHYLKIKTYTKLLTAYLYNGDEKAHKDAVENIGQKLDKTPTNLAFYYCQLGVYFVFSNSEKSLHYLLKAKQILEVKETVDYFILSKINTELSIVFHQLESYFLSVSYAMSEVHVLRQGGIEPSCYTYDSIGAGGLLNPKKELYFFNKAITEIEKKEGLNSPKLVLPYLNIAITYLDSQNDKEALIFIEKSLANIKTNKLDYFNLLSYIRYHRARIFNIQLLHTKAINELNLITNEDSLAETRFKIDIKALYALCHAQIQDFQKAYQILNKAIGLQISDYEAADIILSTPPIINRNEASNLEDLISKKIEILHLNHLHEANNLKLICANIFTVQVYLLTTKVILSYLKSSESKQRQNKIFGPTYANCFSKIVGYLNITVSNEAAFQKAMIDIQQANQAYYPIGQFDYINSLKDVQDLLVELIERDKASTLTEFVIQKNKVNLPQEIKNKEDYFYYKTNQIVKDIQLQESIFFNTTFASEEEDKALFKLFETRNNFVNEWEKYELFKIEYPEYFNTEEEASDFKALIDDYQKIQEKLAEGQAILNYFIVEDQLYINYITPLDFKIEKVGLPKNFDQLIKKFKIAINHIKSNNYIKVANQLYELLIEPIQKHLNNNAIDQLYIIPHKVLSTLPFECIFHKKFEEESGLEFNNFPYLIEKHSISYHYSLTLLYENLQTIDKSVVPTASSYVGYAPVYKNNRESNVQIPVIQEATRSVRIGHQDYQELLHSEKEIESVQDLFNQQNVTAETYLHQKATIDEFTNSVESKDIIHIAAHGYELGSGVELAGIVFSPEESHKNHEEAIFYLQDAYNLNLKADLVVLSSCKSGVGKYIEGEGVMAMNRGFIQAGAKNVLYTLFKIYDEVSSKFIQYFFKQVLEQKQSYNKALQLTKVHFIKSAKYSPIHWAGFVLIGD